MSNPAFRFDDGQRLPLLAGARLATPASSSRADDGGMRINEA